MDGVRKTRNEKLHPYPYTNFQIREGRKFELLQIFNFLLSFLIFVLTDTWTLVIHFTCVNFHWLSFTSTKIWSVFVPYTFISLCQIHLDDRLRNWAELSPPPKPLPPSRREVNGYTAVITILFNVSQINACIKKNLRGRWGGMGWRRIKDGGGG